MDGEVPGNPDIITNSVPGRAWGHEKYEAQMKMTKYIVQRPIHDFAVKL